ncbi:hypothetical protein ABAC402_07635 [Asticcacaulis sp. AC402]|nr:hypothetical protein ABAC402_07635 [Asticcacaulis sp. AC402]
MPLVVDLATLILMMRRPVRSGDVPRTLRKLYSFHK